MQLEYRNTVGASAENLVRVEIHGILCPSPHVHVAIKSPRGGITDTSRNLSRFVAVLIRFLH